MLKTGPEHGKRMTCATNLKHIGLATRMFATDFGGLPFQVSGAENRR
jgi:hypothetical protein